MRYTQSKADHHKRRPCAISHKFGTTRIYLDAHLLDIFAIAPVNQPDSMVYISPQAMRALTLTHLPEDDQEEACGTYSGSRQSTPKPVDSDTHPAKLWFAPSAGNTRSIIIGSDNTAALLGVFNKEFAFISHPRIVLDGNGKSILIGNLGDSVRHVFPVSISDDLSRSNAYGFLPSSSFPNLQHLADSEKVANRTLAQEETKGDEATLMLLHELTYVPSYLDGLSAHVACLPTLIPLPFGHNIQPGPLPDATVRTKLEAIHPNYGFWYDAVVYQQAHYLGKGLSAADLNVHPDFLPDTQGGIISTCFDIGDAIQYLRPTSELGREVIRAQEAAMANNVDNWIIENMEQHRDRLRPIQDLLDPPPAPGGPAPFPGRAGGTPEAFPNARSSLSNSDRATERRRLRTEAMFKLYGCRIVTDTATGDARVELPTISPGLESALAESSPTHAARPLIQQLQQYIQDRQNTRDYMYQMIAFPYGAINIPFVGAVTNFHFRGTAMSDDRGLLSDSISIFGFLAPKVNTAEYIATRTATNQILNEVTNCESESKRTRSTTGLYTGGNQSTLDHLQSGIANMESFISFMYQYDDTIEIDYPLVVAKLRDIFDLFSNAEFQTWFRTWSSQAEWLCHSMLLEVHNVIRALVTFATKPSLIQSVLDGHDIAVSELQPFNNQVRALQAKVTDLLNTTSLGNYQSQPISWNQFKPVPPAGGDQSNKRPRLHDYATANPAAFTSPPGGSALRDRERGRGGSDPNRGDVQLAAGSTITRPPMLSNDRRLCFPWATRGESCPNGNDCRFAHLNYPNVGSATDRREFERWVTATPGLDWAPGAGPANGAPSRSETATRPTRVSRATPSGNRTPDQPGSVNFVPTIPGNPPGPRQLRRPNALQKGIESIISTSIFALPPPRSAKVPKSALVPIPMTIAPLSKTSTNGGQQQSVRYQSPSRPPAAAAPAERVTSIGKAREPKGPRPTGRPTLSRSLNQEYFNRSALPKAYELAQQQPFGKPNRKQTYLSEKALPHVLLLLYKSGLLRKRDWHPLWKTFRLARHLWKEWKRLRHVDFCPLREPYLGWKDQQAVNVNRVEMRLACLLHYDMDVSAVVRYIGGHHVGAQRNPNDILPRVEGLVPPDVYRDLKRILTDGCPAKFNASGTLDQFRASLHYGNHKSLAGDIEAVMKVMNKEDSRENVMAFPKWTVQFIANVMLTAQGLLKIPGKNARLLYDATHMVNQEARPYNFIADPANEPDIVFGKAWVLFLIEIYNLRISYPTAELLPMDDDVTGAYRVPKYHPDVVPAKAYTVKDLLFFYTGGTFGDNTSPANFEPFARCRMALAEHLSATDAAVPEYGEYLDAVEFSPPPPPGTTFVRAKADRLNPGKIAADGTPMPTRFNMHVDDNLYVAAGEARLRKAMRHSIHALQQVLGEDAPNLRPNAVDRAKFLREPIGHRRSSLGFLLDTRLLQAALPPEKKEKLRLLLTETWGPHRRSFTIMEAAELLGVLLHACQVCAWGKFLFIALHRALHWSLSRHHQCLARTPEFQELVAQYEDIKDTGSRSAQRWFGRRVAAAMWNCTARTFISGELRAELDFLRLVLNNPAQYMWASPIAFLIPRVADSETFGDACLTGAGGFSFDLDFLWDLEWPDEIERRTLRHTAKGDPSLISINLLEYATVILGLAGAILSWEMNGSPLEDHPIFRIWTDNTTADSWTRRVSGMHAPQARSLARLFCHLLMFSNAGIDASHIAGVQNDIADCLSRQRRADPHSRFSFDSILQTLREHTYNKGAARTTRSRQNHYLTFCELHALDDPYLSTLTARESNLVFAAYAVHLAIGHTLLCRTIKSGTIMTYLREASKEVIKGRSEVATSHRDAILDPRYDITTGNIHSDIKGVEKEVSRWESMPNRREPLTKDMVTHLSLTVDTSAFFSIDYILSDWFVLGLYTGFRLHEWAQSDGVTKVSRVQLAIDGTPAAMTANDFTFFGENRRRMSHATALARPYLVISVDIRWRFQKNGQNGEQKTVVRNDPSPAHCGVRSSLRIVQRCYQLGLDKDTHPACVFTDDGTATGSKLFVTEIHIAETLQRLAMAVYNITDPDELAKFTSHSIRVGACVALHAANVKETDIQHALRWRSQSFWNYLRNLPGQAQRCRDAINNFNPTRLTVLL